jgi:hypothetical protein
MVFDRYHLFMHRLLAVLGVVALPLSAATFEARSPQHAVVVERSDGGQTEVRVTDVATNAVLLHSTLSNNHLSAKTEGDPSVSLSATETNHTLSVVMRVESRGVTTDLITGSWLVSPMAAGESAPLRVGGDIKAPIAIRRVEPVYPESARHDHVEGVVILEAVIDATGHVRNVTVLKGLPTVSRNRRRTRSEGGSSGRRRSMASPSM